MTLWISRNIIAVVLVLVFISIYVISRGNEAACLNYGTTGMDYLNREYYRWFSCLFLHYNLGHLLANSAALLSVGSLLVSCLKKNQTLFLFLFCGVLAEIAFSVVISERMYDIGASSGIFALIACLIVCKLRFPEEFRFVWHRPDVIIIGIYFIFANTSITAFLVHAFGFVFGILVSFILVLTEQIRIQ